MRVPANMIPRLAAVLLIAGIAVADAAPLVPPSDQPGRERYRFTPSPLDRFFESRPPGQAAVALGVRQSPRRAREIAPAPQPGLLTCCAGALSLCLLQ